MTDDVVTFMNERLGMDLTPTFDEYLRRASLPVLELAFDEKAGTVVPTDLYYVNVSKQ